ncbi:nucleoside 2-deoxyribosyltransferase [Levilactobacillus bambusae]|uniref:Nucleoside 2-deoxyribosyltransferase n=1 Tax=Levilactobacillus bambusae TaxID=2024736 RepID=A0A2V1N118_9LACO|nr:nucleoside 2-deoxyribosyltransferase [Levilactobacillus bambusae]PWG00713.1 nucleoside 2-deoxyribosyltransferase [Levilactobacillus bambusae]
MKIYLAGPFFDDEQINRIKRVEEALSTNVTVTDFFSPRAEQIENLEVGTPEWAQAIFDNDVDHLQDADVVVAVSDFVGDNVDSGTAFEVGYAVRAEIPVVLLHEKESPVNIMLSQSLTAYLTDAAQLAAYDFKTMPESHYNGPVI